MPICQRIIFFDLQEEVIDVDEAINEGLDQVQMQDMSYLDGPEHDTSFEIPVNLDQTDGLDHDVLPMGDEVSMGVISRESGHFDTPQPPMPNPNRVTGRRGGGRSGGKEICTSVSKQILRMRTRFDETVVHLFHNDKNLQFS